jgi:hypothetical protein
MTTTTTKPKTASAELAALRKMRDKLHGAVLEANAAIRAYEVETEGLRSQYTAFTHAHPEQFEGGEKRAKAGTEAERLRDQIQERLRGENPHQAVYDDVFPRYREADQAMQDFQRCRIHDLLAELDPDAERAIERIRDGFTLLAQGCEEYSEAVGKVRDIVIDTPGLTGPDHGCDGRPAEWRRFAENVLEGEIGMPGLTATAVWKVERHA